MACPGSSWIATADQLVTQFQSAGADAWRDELIGSLTEATGCSNIYDRSDGATRAREGLPEISGVLRGAPIRRRRSRSSRHGTALAGRRHGGHKTGYYIDQRGQRGCGACTGRVCTSSGVVVSRAA